MFWREKHDAFNWALGRFATACQVLMTIEFHNLLCQHISQPGRLHFSGMHSRAHRQGKIPDGVFDLAEDYLHELKTILAASSRHGHASGYSAVDKRAGKINAEYMKTAHAIDVKWNGPSRASRVPSRPPFGSAATGVITASKGCALACSTASARGQHRSYGSSPSTGPNG